VAENYSEINKEINSITSLISWLPDMYVVG